jgi:cell wall-associated NlpC family hydrolase
VRFASGHVRSARPRRWSIRAAIALLAFISCLSLVPAALADPAPANPTDAQIAAAMANKTTAASDVGRLSALLATAQSQLDAANNEAELKGELYNKAIGDLEDAKAAADVAQAAVTAAQAQVDQARIAFKSFIKATYISGDVGGTGGSLLTADDPNAVLQKADLVKYASTHQVSAIADMDRATVVKSNADASARDAVQKTTDLAAQAETARNVAVAARNAAVAQQASLSAQMVTYQQQLAAAQIALTGLSDQRAAYQQWQVEEAARIAAQKAQEEAARQAALRASASSNTSGSAGGSQDAPAVAAGSWTPALGQAAVAYAEKWIGQAYAWAGGNNSGPTYGVNSPGTDGWNDSKVYGFDCSGLVKYAWYQAAGLSMAHYAATQYSSGSIHPSNSSLTPGDLVFYSSNRTVAGIHHVAMYIGNGQMIEAPNSGSTVHISPMRFGSEYYGATRPLT